MEKEMDYLLAELNGRIVSLETDRQKYITAHTSVKRNNGYRIFRKVVGVLLEVLCYLAVLASIAGIVLIGEVKSEVLHRLMLDNMFVSHIAGPDKFVEAIDNLSLTMQVLVGILGVCFGFLAYVLAKVRIRNNSIARLSDLLENTIRGTEEQLNRARYTQMEFMRWKVAKENQHMPPPPVQQPPPPPQQ